MKLLGAIALLPAFALWCGAIAQRTIVEWDLEISRWCHRSAQRRLWFLITRLGDGWLYATVFFGLRNHDRKPEAQHLAACVFVAWGICSLLKMIVRRPRRNPAWAMTRVRLRQGRLRILSTWNSWSFPSQHAACAVAFAVAVPNPATVAMAAAVCASRVLIGAHYLGDVLAGVLVGLAAGKLA